MGKSRYLDISSANRDRTIYPNPFEFAVSSGSNVISDPKYISDGVSDQAPYDGDVSVTGFDPAALPAPHNNDTNLFTLNSTSASPVQGSYIGEYIEIFSATSLGPAPYDVYNGYVGTFKVLNYDPTVFLITIDGYVDMATYVGYTSYYYFRHQNWPSYRYLIKSATYSSVTIGEVVQNPDSYLGLWLQPTDFSPQEMWFESKKITKVVVDDILNTTTFNISASPSPVLDPLDVGVFPEIPGSSNPNPNTIYINVLGVYNNVQPLIYSGTLIGNQHKRCYHLDLCDFIISGTTAVIGGIGGAVSTYPYIYMEFQSLTQKNIHTLVSTNQFSSPALFKISTSSDMITTFINMRSSTSQTILFNPNDSFYIRFYKPNGDTLQWVTADNAPPNEPNRFLQVSFTIRMTPVSRDMCVE